jgi:hypothetical protein
MKRRIALHTNASYSAVLDEVLGIFSGYGAEAYDIQFSGGTRLTIGFEKQHTILIGSENGEREFLGGRHSSFTDNGNWSGNVTLLVLPKAVCDLPKAACGLRVNKSSIC